MARLRVGVLISGRGSNLQALIDAAAAADFPAEIVLTISNRPDAQGLERAGKAGIATRVIEHGKFAEPRGVRRGPRSGLASGPASSSSASRGSCASSRPDFVEAWRDRLINIHPSLLPAFPGLHTHERALQAGVRLHGCTVHFVRSQVDDGPIIVQAAVPVLAGDDAEKLAERVLAAEHRAYPLALALIAAGRVRVEGERVVIEGALPATGMLLNPRQTPELAGALARDRHSGNAPKSRGPTLAKTASGHNGIE